MIHHMEDLPLIHHMEDKYPQYGRPSNDPPYRRPANDTSYGRLNNDGPRDPYTAYPVEYFSKREYPSGSSKVAPSASYERYAATTRLPNRELPSSISPGADYMSCRSYLDQVPTDRYSNRVTLQLGLLRAGNSNVQQLGITRAGNSNAYDYTEVHFQCVSLPLLCKWPSPDMFPLET